MSDDTNYQIDKVQIQNSLIERVSQSISMMEASCSVSDVGFVKSVFKMKKVRDRKAEPNISFTIGMVVTQAAALSGLKSDVSEQISQDVVNMIFIAFPDLTIEEIIKAFQMERYGQLIPKTEHFQLFNADYVSTILRKYKSWKSQIKKEHNITNQKEIEVNKDEIQTVKVAGIIDCYETWVDTGKVEDIRFNVFDMLYAVQVIPKQGSDPKVDERYSQIVQEAKQQKISEMTLLRVEARDNKSEVKRLQDIYTEITNDIGNHLDNRVKSLVLVGFFRKLNIDFNGREKLENILREKFYDL